MKINKCRNCKEKKFINLFSLGKLSYTGKFPKNKKINIPKEEIKLIMCSICKLVQMSENFSLSYMYNNDYGYRTGINKTMTDHVKKVVSKAAKIVKLKKGEQVLDIASNDGTLLNFYPKDVVKFGIDPTIKKLSKFYRKDIIKIPEFFSESILTKYLKNKKAKIITTISMFYDLPKPIQFAKDIYKCLADDGIWHLEQSYMPSMIKNVSYDTICHEHLEYYSLQTIKYIFDIVGFKIIDLEFNDINGGSFSITVAKKSSKFLEYSRIVNWLLEKEEILNYNSPSTHINFYKSVKNHKKLLKDLILNLNDMKKKVIGYGASTKGNVILQFCNIGKNDLKFIADVNIDKKDKYTPGSLIKITDEKAIKKYKPDYMLVLPWHFKNFILLKEKKYLDNGGKIIFPLPDIEIV